jgi:hypothetical protein
MDRKLWKTMFSEKSYPTWSCPECKRGRIRFSTDSSNYSERPRFIDDLPDDPEQSIYLFTTWLECSDRDCRHTFVITGHRTIALERDDEAEIYGVLHFEPKFFYPMPDIIELPEEYDRFCTIMKEAFSLFWSHPYACANRIRVAIECLVDILEGAGTEDLYERINKMKNQHFKDQLHSIRFLGNSGTHNHGPRIYHDELLDAFEVIEYILQTMKHTINKSVLKEKEDKITKITHQFTNKYQN